MLERSETDGVTGSWIIETQAYGYVGYCGMEYFSMAAVMESKINSGVHLQIALHPRVWGRGVATRATETLVDYAFRHCGLRRIFAGVYKFNERGHQLMLRCQFCEVERLTRPNLVMYERLVVPHVRLAGTSERA
jgi:RimJ/RimL family protein N-acetyltransferase